MMLLKDYIWWKLVKNNNGIDLNKNILKKRLKVLTKKIADNRKFIATQ